MVVVEKLYFTLREIAGRWSLQADDLAYMAENGLLRVSVRLFGAHIEQGVYEHDTRDGQPHRIPFEHAVFTGLQDLLPWDAFKVFADGMARVVHFDAPGDAYTALIAPTDSLDVPLSQLVVRREERDRVEGSNVLLRQPPVEQWHLQQFDDYREVHFGDLRLSLGRLQARVVKLLHEASRSGDGWRAGKSILADAGSASKRMQDVFKSQPRWRDLIESDRHGRYRLRIKPR